MRILLAVFASGSFFPPLITVILQSITQAVQKRTGPWAARLPLATRTAFGTTTAPDAAETLALRRIFWSAQ